jgi:hypothetical protein
LILIDWHDFTLSLDTLLKLLTNLIGGLLRDTAGSEQEDTHG